MLFYTTVPGCPGMGEEPFVQGHPGQSSSHPWPSLSSLSKRLQRHPSLEMLSLHWLTPTRGWLGGLDVKASGSSAALQVACKDKPWGWSPCDHKTSQKKLKPCPSVGCWWSTLAPRNNPLPSWVGECTTAKLITSLPTDGLTSTNSFLWSSSSYSSYIKQKVHT